MVYGEWLGWIESPVVLTAARGTEGAVGHKCGTIGADDGEVGLPLDLDIVSEGDVVNNIHWS